MHRFSNPCMADDRLCALLIDDLVKSTKPARTVIPANAGIQSFQMVMDSGYRIESGTSFAGVTGIETFYDFVID